MTLTMTVTERTERWDGTIRVVMIEAGGSSLELHETRDRPYRPGDRYELVLVQTTPLPGAFVDVDARD